MMRRRAGPPLRRDQGLTLLELVVAVAVLAAGSIAVLKSMDRSRHALSGAMPRLLAQVAANNRAEELRFLGPEAGRLPPAVPMGPYEIRLTERSQATAAGLRRVEIQARSPDGPGAPVVTYLPPETGR